MTVVHGSHVAVRELDLTLSPGRVTVLMGRNGSGKSSLIWALQGSGRRRAGTVHVAGDDPADLAPAERRTHVGLVPQTAADLLYLETVADECAAADAGAGAEPGTCRGLLDRLAPGIDDAIHPRDLSEGQRLALALSIVLAARPPVVLLDEPTRGLDYAGKAELARIVADLAADGHAVLLATHDVEFAAHVADEVVVMAEGEIVSQRHPAAGARRVAVVRPAGHQGPRTAVAGRRGGRGGAGAGRGRTRMSILERTRSTTPQEVALPIGPRTAAGAGPRLGRRADDAVLAAAARRPSPGTGSSRRSCSSRCSRS